MHAIIAVKHDFVIHKHSQCPSGGAEQIEICKDPFIQIASERCSNATYGKIRTLYISMILPQCCAMMY